MTSKALIAFSIIMICLKCTFSQTVRSFKYQRQVMLLDAHNIANALVEFEHIVIMFYAPWCIHCKSMTPIYQQASKQIAKQQIKIKMAKLDCTKDTQLCKHYEIRGYPSIIYFKDATKVSSYNNANSLARVIKFVMRQFGHVQTIDQRYYQKIKSFATVSVVSHSDDLRDPIFDTLVALSDKDEYNNYYFLLSQNKYKVGSIEMFRPFEEQPLIFNKQLFPYQQQLQKWIQIYDKPAVSELDQRIVHQTTFKMKSVFIFFNFNSILTLEDIFNETALDFQRNNPGQLLFSIAKKQNKLGKQISQHIKIDAKKYPFVFNQRGKPYKKSTRVRKH